MRKTINLVENILIYEDMPSPSKQFVTAVRNRLKAGTHYGDYQAPASSREFTDDINTILLNIRANALSGPLVTAYRAEIRPMKAIKQPTTLGVYWTWHADSAVAAYGHDFADDLHGVGKKVSVTYEAEIKATDIDWVATAAANLALPHEREITVLQWSRVKLLRAWVSGKEIFLQCDATISNVTQYDQI